MVLESLIKIENKTDLLDDLDFAIGLWLRDTKQCVALCPCVLIKHPRRLIHISRDLSQEMDIISDRQNVIWMKVCQDQC